MIPFGRFDTLLKLKYLFGNHVGYISSTYYIHLLTVITKIIMSAEETQQEENTKRYIAIPKYKNSFQEDGEYTKDLDSGKRATIICTTEWRWGECNIEVTEEERKEILKSNEVRLSDYLCEFRESTDGWKGENKLKDADSFTKEEKQEIMESLRNHEDDDEEEEENSNEEDKPESDPKMKREDFNIDELIDYVGDCDTEYMEEEGEWGLDESYYYICGGCVLVPDGEDVEDYAQGDGSYANKEETETEPVVSVFNTTTNSPTHVEVIDLTNE